MTEEDGKAIATMVLEFSELLRAVRETLDLGTKTTRIETKVELVDTKLDTIEDKLDRALAGRYTPEQVAELTKLKDKLGANDQTVDQVLETFAHTSSKA